MGEVLKQVVIEAFPSFSKKCEGYVNHLYLDIRALVTIGVGFLVDTVEEACALPFVHKDTGMLALRKEIADEWKLVKSKTALACQGAQAAAKVTTLMLTNETIDKLLTKKLLANAAYVSHIIPQLSSFPANAQLAIMSLCWAMGAGIDKTYPKFTAACKRQAWDEAAEEIFIKETNNAGVKARNEMNKALLLAIKTSTDVAKINGI